MKNGDPAAGAQFRAEAAEEKLARYIYRVSHDLGGQVRLITAFVERLRTDCGDHLDERGQQYLRFIENASRRTHGMLRALRELSRIDRAEPRFVQLSWSELLAAAIAELGEDGPRVNLCVEGEEEVLTTDPDLLTPVLAELLRNALRFAERPTLPVRAAATVQAEGSVLTLGDEGPGIPSSYHEVVFELFRALHAEGRFPGVGAGLALARARVGRLGGSLTLSDRPGGGLLATLRLPATDLPVAE